MTDKHQGESGERIVCQHCNNRIYLDTVSDPPNPQWKHVGSNFVECFGDLDTWACPSEKTIVRAYEALQGGGESAPSGAAQLTWNQRAFELLAALHHSVEWELAPSIKTNIARLVEEFVANPQAQDAALEPIEAYRARAEADHQEIHWPLYLTFTDCTEPLCKSRRDVLARMYESPAPSLKESAEPRCPKCGSTDLKWTAPYMFCVGCKRQYRAAAPADFAQFFSAPQPSPSATPQNDGSEPVLCYVEGDIAYFTTRELSQQWGDDWDDAPYEHNAGTPYQPSKGHDYKDGESAPWRITEIKFGGPFEQPCSGSTNSPYSVQQINAGAVPWLRTSSWANTSVYIPAGTKLSCFKSKVREAGGRIFIEESACSGASASPSAPEQTAPEQKGASLLRKPSTRAPEGCYCQPGHCAAPKIMGRQMPCRDPQKAAESALAPTSSAGRGAMINRIQQEDVNGCVVAALAMIVGKDYATVKAELPPKDLSSQAYNSFHAESYLYENGFSLLKKWKHVCCSGTDRTDWPIAPFAPIHYVEAIMGESGKGHALVMLADGAVLDPATAEPRRLTDYYRINEIFGVFTAEQNRQIPTSSAGDREEILETLEKFCQAAARNDGNSGLEAIEIAAKLAIKLKNDLAVAGHAREKMSAGDRSELAEARKGKEEALTLAKEQIAAARKAGFFLVQISPDNYEWRNLRAEAAERELAALKADGWVRVQDTTTLEEKR